LIGGFLLGLVADDFWLDFADGFWLGLEDGCWLDLEEAFCACAWKMASG
jgi:hypothetical protein